MVCKSNINSHDYDTLEKYILAGIPVIFFVGSIFHFLYQWSGHSTIIAMISPVNESPWEHLKLVLWPTILWWLIGYYTVGKKTNSTPQLFAVCCLSSLLVSMTTILAFFYTYTGILGIESLILDILGMLIGIILGQLMALHIVKYCNPSSYWLYISVFIIAAIVIIFAIFTFYPPKLPVFVPPNL